MIAIAYDNNTNRHHNVYILESRGEERGGEVERTTIKTKILTMYTVQFFIDKFEAIPEEYWCTGVYENGRAKCANGHCGIESGMRSNEEAEALADILLPLQLNSKFIYHHHKILHVTGQINDGHTRYQQPTPKQRILAALYDIKKMQQPEVKEKIVYVAVPVTITEQAKELVMS